MVDGWDKKMIARDERIAGAPNVQLVLPLTISLRNRILQQANYGNKIQCIGIEWDLALVIAKY
jgi:hypothetical protein